MNLSLIKKFFQVALDNGWNPFKTMTGEIVDDLDPSQVRFETEHDDDELLCNERLSLWFEGKGQEGELLRYVLSEKFLRAIARHKTNSIEGRDTAFDSLSETDQVNVITQIGFDLLSEVMKEDWGEIEARMEFLIK